MDDFMYSQLGQTREHTERPHTIPDRISIHANTCMQAAGLKGNSVQGEEIFDRMVDYSEWLEDHFDRGLEPARR